CRVDLQRTTATGSPRRRRAVHVLRRSEVEAQAHTVVAADQVVEHAVDAVVVAADPHRRLVQHVVHVEVSLEAVATEGVAAVQAQVPGARHAVVVDVHALDPGVVQHAGADAAHRGTDPGRAAAQAGVGQRAPLDRAAGVLAGVVVAGKRVLAGAAQQPGGDQAHLQRGVVAPALQRMVVDQVGVYAADHALGHVHRAHG